MSAFIGFMMIFKLSHSFKSPVSAQNARYRKSLSCPYKIFLTGALTLSIVENSFVSSITPLPSHSKNESCTPFIVGLMYERGGM